eukprot:1159831-Pelagomonas_calceolata.AAC.7
MAVRQGVSERVHRKEIKGLGWEKGCAIRVGKEKCKPAHLYMRAVGTNAWHPPPYPQATPAEVDTHHFTLMQLLQRLLLLRLDGHHIHYGILAACPHAFGLTPVLRHQQVLLHMRGSDISKSFCTHMAPTLARASALAWLRHQHELLHKPTEAIKH